MNKTKEVIKAIDEAILAIDCQRDGTKVDHSLDFISGSQFLSYRRRLCDMKKQITDEKIFFRESPGMWRPIIDCWPMGTHLGHAILKAETLFNKYNKF